jgi:hypothetical protein
MGAFLGLMFLGLGIACIRSAFQWHAIHQKRIAALHGDFTDMPLSVIRPFPELAPDVNSQPIEILWRVNPGTTFLQTIILILSLASGLLIPVVNLAFVFIPMLAPSFEPALFASSRNAPLDTGEIVTLMIDAIAVVGIAAVLIWFFARFGPAYYLGRPYGMRVTADGVEERTPGGKRIFLAWNEIRLFEALATQPFGVAVRGFAIYAPGKAIWWPTLTPAMTALPVGATALENAHRLAALVNLITAHTGLEPRTIERKLERPANAVPFPPLAYPTAPYPPMPVAPVVYPPAPETYVAVAASAPAPAAFGVAGAPSVPFAVAEDAVSVRRRASNRRQWAVVWSLAALGLVVLACAEGFVPITDYGVVNWLSVAALVGLVVNAILRASGYFKKVKPVSPATVAGPPPVTSPMLDSATSAYALRYRAPTNKRWRLLITSTLMAINVIPAAIGLIQAAISFFSLNFSMINHQLSSTDPTGSVFTIFDDAWIFILGGILGFLGLGGATQLFVALRLNRAPAVTIRVDADGLSQLTILKPTLVPWSNIQEIIWTPRGVGDAPAYMVRCLSDGGVRQLSWPTSAQYLDSSLMSADARTIGPDELAALVAARIGRPIRVIE